LYGANALRNIRRAYALAPYNVIVSIEMTDRLFEQGLREEARTIAVSQQDGGPLQREAGSTMMLRVAVAEGKLGGGLDRAMRALRGPPGAGYSVNLRWGLAVLATHIAWTLGRPREVSDAFLPGLLEGWTSLVDSTDGDAPARLATLCALASKDLAARCFEKLESMITTGSFANVTETSRAVVDGANRYRLGDYAGASRKFRLAAQNPIGPVRIAQDVIADAFERHGDDALVELVDAPSLEAAGSGGEVSLANVRAARRAMKAGDREKAKCEAERVIKAWSVADVDVPAVAEMRALLAKAH
jgi:hypothetical protein